MTIEATGATATGNAVSVAGLSAVTIAAAIGQIDVAVLLGAFAGSVVFVMSAKEYHWIMRLGYLLAGTVISYLSAPWTAGLLALTSVTVAAIINGVLCIAVLNGLIEKGRSGKALSAIIDILQALRK
ncbi:MAG: putative holin [Agitococcus sp.]|nr:putative holin [Agitococcus sp.]